MALDNSGSSRKGSPVDRDQSDGKPAFKYSFAYERATLYEYKFERQAEPDEVNPCLRCNKTVSRPDEMVSIGPDVQFHKQCFRCRICGMPLTQQTFYRNDRINGNMDKEVYCKTHVGKTPGEIEGATITQTTAPVRGGSKDSPNSKYIIQIQGKSKKPASPQSVTSARNASPSTTFGSSNYTMNGTGGSLTSVTPRSFDYTNSMGNHSSQSFAHPKNVLVSFEDFERSGVFEAQVHLEQRHREEEERLQRFLSEEREKEMRKLDDSIHGEKELAAAELLSNIDQLSLQHSAAGSSLDLVHERQRIEEHFRRVREERLKNVTDRLASDEKMRTSKMVERQGQEMMLLIAEKDREFDKNALFDHSTRPPILPPSCKKVQLYRSPTVFRQLDERAIELANREYNNFTDLVRDLTRYCNTELEKVRVLFRWVIAKDLNRNAVKQILHPNASLSLLKGVKSGKESYHQLFKKLCSFAGIHCEIIIGYSKGAGYKPGMRIDGNAFRNSWTAVAIDGSWRFINCTWAARHISGHKDDLPQVFHTYDEFYFLTDPEDYIYQHYPDESSWQLLDIPLPFSEFINLPVVKSPFFNYGLRFYSNYGATISTDSGLIEIRLVMPKILGFGSLLEHFEKSSDKKDLEGRSLLRLVKNEAIFTVSLPQPGIYYFSIYTGDYWHSECLESACSFLINCKRLLGPPAPPYPPVPFFGATPALEELNITMQSHPDPLIVSNNETMEIVFHMDSNIKITHSFQYFDTNDGSISDIDRYVFLRSRTEKETTYMIRCPKEGFYIFSLYAADSKTEAQTLDCVYRYLVVSQEPNPLVNVFPKTFHRWQKCTLYEPLSGDLLTGRRYVFRLEVPRAVEVFVVNGEIWSHLKRRVGHTWEGSVLMPNTAGVTKVFARFTLERESSIFAHLLDYELIEDAETEI
ncbi:kyphoscoliosis peptidase-like [Octopus vulgaris]|uniref:Kyphoscoliosis peptidase-like n=2 Tax=Octopus TaxID=6643 RepID=A0AA36BX05_OCTVU|nr:kyphoscoliosis peptidase-like [Octopus vulgaris]